MTDLQSTLETIIKATPAYTFGGIKITSKPINGSKVGYAGGAVKGSPIVSGYICIDSAFIEHCKDNKAELIDTIKHELAHLIAETVNDKAKRVWHGKAWATIHKALGGSGDRYYTGKFAKAGAPPKMTMAEKFAIQATEPKETWEKGTFDQWLRRGYHVIKGQKGTFATWTFVNENSPYEAADGVESTFGRQSAFYFTPDQVEPNKVAA